MNRIDPTGREEEEEVLIDEEVEGKLTPKEIGDAAACVGGLTIVINDIIQKKLDSLEGGVGALLTIYGCFSALYSS